MLAQIGGQQLPSWVEETTGSWRRPTRTSATRLLAPPPRPSQSPSQRAACQVSGVLASHGDPSLGLPSIKDNGFYVHREVTLTLRPAQGKQTGIEQIKILPTPG